MNKFIQITFSKPLPCCLSLLFLLMTFSVQAASLPKHEPISILIIADEVNPHQLADDLLTQPQDLVPALTAFDSGLNTSELTLVNSQCIDQAIEALRSQEPPDVLLYFAHRAAITCDGTNAQDILTALLETGLNSGLGIVVLHHGLYVDFINRGAKAQLLALIGAESDSISWDTDKGQRVYQVGGKHFISNNGLDSSTTAFFVGTDGVSPGSYSYFENIPDELYSITRLHVVDGEIRTPLFASDSEGERLLGYTLTRQGWEGRVIVYQPGEYQPNALDDRSGPNFQVLANALYYAVYGDD